MTDEILLTAAKLYEQASGDLDGDPRLNATAGLPMPDDDAWALSFVEDAYREHASDYDLPARFQDTDLGQTIDRSHRNEAARQAVQNSDSTVMSYLVGVTEQELDGSSLTLPIRILEELENGGAPAFVLAAGNPNTGKTNTVFLLAELWKLRHDDGLIISNSPTWEHTDIAVGSAHELIVACLEHRDRPKFLVVDESSTHFDARTKSHEVSTQWTPLAKAFAKVGVDAVANIGHTGKDLHPELKRLTTLGIWKDEKKTAEFFGQWPEDSSTPTDRLFGGPVEHLEPHEPDSYDPDDRSPWAWNLDPETFERGDDWKEVHAILIERGPVV